MKKLLIISLGSEYRSGARTDDITVVMKSIADNLTQEQIDAVANHLGE